MTMLTVSNLSISFHTDEGLITPIQNVNFSLDEGRTLGIVGESGSGKSVSTKALMRLLPKNSNLHEESQMHYIDKQGKCIEIEKVKLYGEKLRRLRGGEIAMIFQEPMASFSPVYTIGAQIGEIIRIHQGLKGKEGRELAIDMLAKVGISSPQKRIDQYSYEFSGGMRQRAMIALALSAQPRLLIADEPTTALDVTIQAQILNLLKDFQADLGMGMIFITHDLGVVAQVVQDVAVMYLGTVVEQGPVKEVLKQAYHPYTQGLIRAIPRIDCLQQRLEPVPGELPSPSNRPRGCAFHPRCSQAIKGVCDKVTPKQIKLSSQHTVHCHLYQSGSLH